MDSYKNKERDAFQRGYRVLDDGTVIGPAGNTKKCRFDQSGRRVFYFRPTCARLMTKVPVARLAAFQKFGDALYEPGIEAQHENGVMLDDRPVNIVLGTKATRLAKVPPEQLSRMGLLGAAQVRKLTPEQVEEIRREREQRGTPLKKLAKKYGVAKSTMSLIVNGLTYSLPSAPTVGYLSDVDLDALIAEAEADLAALKRAREIALRRGAAPKLADMVTVKVGTPVARTSSGEPVGKIESVSYLCKYKCGYENPQNAHGVKVHESRCKKNPRFAEPAPAAETEEDRDGGEDDEAPLD